MNKHDGLALGRIRASYLLGFIVRDRGRRFGSCAVGVRHRGLLWIRLAHSEIPTLL
jgi:hypothetical protein